MAGTLDIDPLLCDLLTNLPLDLEHEVELESVLEFKTTTHAAITEMTQALETPLPGLSHVGALDRITATTALAAMLWQVAHPREALARACRHARASSMACMGLAPAGMPGSRAKGHDAGVGA